MIMFQHNARGGEPYGVRPMTAGRHRPPQDTISSNIIGILLYV